MSAPGARTCTRDRRRRAGRSQDELRDRLLLQRYAQTRDPALREILAERFLPMARHLALRVARGPEPLDDLVQVACIGLLKAIDRYDPHRGAAFSSFATPTIRGELQRYFRDRTWAMRPPRDLQELTLRVQRAATDLAGRLDRSPTVQDVAAEVGVEVADVLEALQAAWGRTLPSLDAPAASDADDDLDLHGRIGRRDPAFAAAEVRADLREVLRALTPRERLILRLRFEEDLTQKEIGARVGLSQMHVSRVLRQALETLRAHVAAADDEGAAASAA